MEFFRNISVLYTKMTRLQMCLMLLAAHKFFNLLFHFGYEAFRCVNVDNNNNNNNRKPDLIELLTSIKYTTRPVTAHQIYLPDVNSNMDYLIIYSTRCHCL